MSRNCLQKGDVMCRFLFLQNIKERPQDCEMEHINYTWKFESSNKLSIYIIFSANGLTLETLCHFSQLRAIKKGRRE